MTKQIDNTSRSGSDDRPTDAVTPVERRLQAALKQEAAYWERQEPARLKSACQAPQEDRDLHAAVILRLRWAGAIVVVACACAAMALYLRQPPVAGGSGNRGAVVIPCTDVRELYAHLPSCPPLPHPPAPTRPEPPAKLVME